MFSHIPSYADGLRAGLASFITSQQGAQKSGGCPAYFPRILFGYLVGIYASYIVSLED
jgi:hypothetical protein